LKLRRFKKTTVAVMDSLDPLGAVGQGVAAEELDRLTGFRGEVYRCLTRRGDELFELAYALLCARGR
jgi:hypothetical protein